MSTDPGGDAFLPLKVLEQDHQFPLTPTATQSTYEGVSTRQLNQGTLFTLYDCTQGPWEAIENTIFDECVKSLGTITKLTEHQKFRGTTVFNGNRYFCMIPKADMPDSVIIPDPQNANMSHKVRLGYKGKAYFCARCQEKHVGQCPAKSEFYEAQKIRATATITKTILSDSTLRQADVTGLAANITCMSGGRVGNVAHMLLDSPDIANQKEVIIIAGVNDITNDNEDREQFLKTVEEGVGQIHRNLAGRDSRLTMVAPPLPSNASSLRCVKLRDYDKLLLGLSHNDDFPFTYLQTKDLGIHMDGYHPTVDGTKVLLTAIHGVVPMINNDKFIVCDRLYQGVATAYKYGCLSCQEYLGLDQNYVCPRCLAPANPSPVESDVNMQGSGNKHLSDTNHPDEIPSKKAMIETKHNGDDN